MTLSLKFLPRPTFRSRASEILAATVRWIGWPARVLGARRVMSQLGAMTDGELKDIGLYRQDLRDASGLSADVDPTPMLGRRVASRQHRG